MDGERFQPTNLDLALSGVIALGLPPVAAWLWERIGGATASLVLYYVVCCVAVVRWRRGSLEYHLPRRWPWALFAASLLVPAAIAAVNFGALPNYGASAAGLALTALVWAPLNALLEQLSWFYVLDAWRLRWAGKAARIGGTAAGVALLLALVALIHILFWVPFLPVAGPSELGWLGTPLNTLLTVVYAALYYRTGSMWPTALVHLAADLQLVLLARYSILPDL